MNYFKNTELAGKYNISESTVRNWIKMSQENKLDLMLVTDRGRVYVANSASNIALIEGLVEKNRKYRNSLTAKTVSPRPEFYEVFSQGQIYDIVRSLELHHEIPRQYNYFDGGADEWDRYINELDAQKTANWLTYTNDLVADNQTYLDRRLSKFQRINIVDIGVGNALPSRGLLGHLLHKGTLGRYIAIDISPDMLKIAKRNVHTWFGDAVEFEGHQLDITFERFANIMAEDYLGKNSANTMNLVLFLGGTASNLRNPDNAFRTINESMNLNDLLIYTDKLEKPEMLPEWFAHDARPGQSMLARRHRLVFDLLNIDESFYDAEVGADVQTRQRYARVRLKVALTLRFNFDDGERIIEFEKGDIILLWRRLWQAALPDVVRQFDSNGFYTLHSSQTEDHEYIMTISEVRRD